MWRKRQAQDGRPRNGLRRLFAWRVDQQDSPQVPLATAPDGMVREGTMTAEGRPDEVMAGMYCGRCGRPNPESSRYCSNCGAPLMRAATGSFSAVPETVPLGTPHRSSRRSRATRRVTTIRRPTTPRSDSLPPGTALLVVLRGPNAGSEGSCSTVTSPPPGAIPTAISSSTT